MIYDDDFTFEIKNNMVNKKPVDKIINNINNKVFINLKIIDSNSKWQDCRPAIIDAIQIKIAGLDPENVDFVSNANNIHQEINQHIRELQSYDAKFFDELTHCRLKIFRLQNIHKKFISDKKTHSGTLSLIGKMIGY